MLLKPFGNQVGNFGIVHLGFVFSAKKRKITGNAFIHFTGIVSLLVEKGKGKEKTVMTYINWM
ncbi:MAG: hypothetical protein IJ057_08500 [Bacteroidales bacterium]|nr:hypothetical protein [Bacteroidales bacterium]